MGLEVGRQEVVQYIHLNSEMVDDRALWHDIKGAYGDYDRNVTRQGDWLLKLRISNHTLQLSLHKGGSSEETAPLGTTVAAWKEMLQIKCDTWVFTYEDPDLKKKSERKRKREQKRFDGSLTIY